MAKNIFVNLPVKDLSRSMAFFKALGFDFNPQFTDDTAACLVLGDNIYAMLLTSSKFLGFTKKQIADTSTSTEVLIAIDVENRQAVDQLVKTAISAGGKLYRQPEDYGWMYGHAFEDLDGHQWEVFWADPTQKKN